VSSTNRSGELRVADDFYETPGWAVRALLPELGKPPHEVVEPACGNGAIVDELKHAWGDSSLYYGFELDPTRAAIADARGGRVRCADFLSLPPEHCWDLAITNPPFVLAQEFAEQCLKVARETALLLRLAFMAGIERSAFLKANPCDVFPLPRRPQFVAVVKCREGKGQVSCGWRITVQIDAPRPKCCPNCGGKRDVVTSDSADYAWFVWGPGRGNRWKILEIDT
jgi:hypothetical protein